jgi:predicted metalloprotease
MRWSPGDRSNIEDRRGMSGASMGGLGIGGLLLLLLISWFTGVDFLSLFSGAGSSPTVSVGTSGKVATSPEEERLVDMVDAVMNDAQQTWAQILPGRYQATTAVLFRDAIQSACGFAESATGPFYCPADRKVYLDLGFFSELHRSLGAPGDFAQAYVLAHELGHHVQTILGVDSQVRRQAAADAAERNALSVRLELQADCFAGVWGSHANREPGGVDLDPGDVDEGLRAAAAIGDDRLHRMQGGRVAPERFTHGTSEQRAQWLRRGLESGDPNNCDTFSR